MVQLIAACAVSYTVWFGPSENTCIDELCLSVVCPCWNQCSEINLKQIQVAVSAKLPVQNEINF